MSLSLAPKDSPLPVPGVNDRGLSRKHLIEAVEGSLRRLGIEYIDLYQVHWWDPYTPIEETLRALDSLVRQGKIRYIGCSQLRGMATDQGPVGQRPTGLGTVRVYSTALQPEGKRHRTGNGASMPGPGSGYHTVLDSYGRAANGNLQSPLGAAQR